MSKRKKQKKTAGKRGTKGIHGRLLELAVHCLPGYGFTLYESHGEYERARDLGELPSRYVVKQYEHQTPWATKGNKDALIVCEEMSWILEVKWQTGGGTACLEKLPYIWLAFQHSPVPHWVFVAGGPFWDQSVPQAAFAYYGMQLRPEGRRFEIVQNGVAGFSAFAAREFARTVRGGV